MDPFPVRPTPSPCVDRRCLSHVRTADGLLIQARLIYEQVAADPRGTVHQARELAARTNASASAEAHVHALRAVARAERALLRPDDARRCLNRAAAWARRYGLDQALAEVLVERAGVDQELGRLPEARRDLRLAGTLLPVDATEVRAEHAKQLGTLLQNGGQLVQAERIYSELLSSPVGSPRMRSIVANNLGLILSQQGRHREALRLLTETTHEAGKVGPAVHALLLQTTAWATVKAGRLADGLHGFARAEAAYREAGLSLGEHYIEYVDAMMDLRLGHEATAAAEQAWAEFGPDGPPLMMAETRLRMAQVALLQGDLELAVVAADDAAERFRRQGRPGWRARAQLAAAEARASAGIGDAADLATLRRAAGTLERLGSRGSAVRAHLAAGRIALTLDQPRLARTSLDKVRQLSRGAPTLVRLNGRIAAALQARSERNDAEVLRQCRTGLEDLRRHRAGLDSMRLRAAASGHGIELGRLGLRVALHRGSPHAVLGWMERTRGAALLPTFETSTVPRPAEIAEALGPRALAEYAVLDDELVAVTVQHGRLSLHPLGAVAPVREEVEALLFALRRMTRPQRPALAVATRVSAERALTRLRALLVDPLAIDPETELVVVPSSRLNRVPWSSLHPAPVSCAPSAALWLRTAARPPAGSSVVLLAGPGLEGATAEVEVLREVYPRALVLAPPESTVDAVSAALREASVAHLACHGRARLDNPMYSELVLSDGSLTVQRLEADAATPYRVVLAACGSGLDAELPADEMLGFVSALMAQGTAGLLSSLASIPDLHTVPLMRRLHQSVAQGRTIAQALHDARRWPADDDPAEFICAVAFTAHGAA